MSEKSKLLEITTECRPGILHHSDSIADTDCSVDEMSHVSKPSGSKNGKENIEKSKMVHLFPPKKCYAPVAFFQTFLYV